MKLRSSLFLMANLGSEAARLYNAKDKNNTGLAEKSRDRALYILREIYTICTPNAKKELKILEEVISANALSNYSKINKKEIEKYFAPFTHKFLQELT